jgi:hypothetical protein
MKLLLDYDSEVYAREDDGLTPLMMNGWKMAQGQRGALIQAVDSFSRTALHHAASPRRLDIAELVVVQGKANINATSTLVHMHASSSMSRG